MERHDSLVQTRQPLKAIIDVLIACATEFKSDRFWADLAIPIDRAIEKFKEEEVALTANEKQVAQKARETAIACLEHLVVQLQQASDAGLFHNEARMIKMVYDTMKSNEILRLDSPLNSMAQAAFAEQAEGIKERQLQAEKQQASVDKVKKAMRPYVFEHSADSCEMSVRVAVPPPTLTQHVFCRLTRDTIRLSIHGHHLQVRYHGSCTITSRTCITHLPCEHLVSELSFAPFAAANNHRWQVAAPRRPGFMWLAS